MTDLGKGLRHLREVGLTAVSVVVSVLEGIIQLLPTLFEAFLKLADPTANSSHELRNLGPAEEEEDDDANEQQFRALKAKDGKGKVVHAGVF